LFGSEAAANQRAQIALYSHLKKGAALERESDAASFEFILGFGRVWLPAEPTQILGRGILMGD